ncbi:MAG: HD domain-containing protein [Anaeroplasmataceae bacterium]|nr:HD domain-containing protein [Anaeroplasmataceae bacterium]
MHLDIPQYIEEIMQKFYEAGHECFLVGGCVRDSILGMGIKDYDLTTDCDAKTIKNIFKDFSIINNNGEKHNTVTIRYQHENIEVTSYKHNLDEPNTIEIDLAHRDITINAIAYAHGKYVDPYGGIEDLKNKRIRAVGNAQDRILEDPLRILRVLRFSSKLDFDIDLDTSNVVHQEFRKLSKISVERIKTELDKILVGKRVLKILKDYQDVITFVITDLKLCVGFLQHNPYHEHDVYIHICNVCKNVRPNVILRTAALLHDIGKPLCFTLDDKGIGHFYGHAEEGQKIALRILKKLKYSHHEIEQISFLVRYHDAEFSLSRKSIKKWLNKVPNYDEELFYMLLELKNADRLDHTIKAFVDIESIKSIVEEIKMDSECFKLKDLAINGYDLMQLGIKGAQIRLILNALLNDVIEEKVSNNSKNLLDRVKKFYL